MPPGKPANSDETEKKLQVVFFVAVGFVVLGLIAFVVLVVKDLQH